MGSGELTFRGGNGEIAFQDILAGFKQRGCNLLVTGEVSETATARLSGRLLGAPTEDRKRVLVLADSSVQHAADRLPENVGVDDPCVWVVDAGHDERAVAGRSPPDERASAGESPTPDARPAPSGSDDLHDALAEVVTAVSHFDAWADGLAPSELRLSLDSLASSLDRHDRDTVERFLRGTTAVVRGVRGMAHYHLPVADDAAVVRELSPLFDARVELRQKDCLVPQQRWHVPAYDRTTNWVRI